MSFRYDRSEYAASTWMLEHMPLKDALDNLHRHGFDDVEIWADTVHLDPRLRPDIPQVKRWLREYGLRVHSLHGPFRHYADRPADDGAFCRLRTRMLKETIDYAEALDCSIMVVHALDRNEYNYTMDHLAVVQDYIGEIARYGRERGVRIAVEDIPPGGDPGEIYTTLRKQKELFGTLGIDFCLDIGHVPLLGADVYDEVDAAGSQLITLHIHNNDGLCDSHNPPDDGILNWPALHDYIRNGGYRGKFVLELFGGESIQEEIELMGRVDALFRD